MTGLVHSQGLIPGGDEAGEAGHTPGPWDYVPGNEHHGPYITSDYGSTIADCYVMSRESAFSSEAPRPISFLAEMAEPNARLIAAAPDLLESLIEHLAINERHMLREGFSAQDILDCTTKARRVIAKATAGETRNHEEQS